MDKTEKQKFDNLIDKAVKLTHLFSKRQNDVDALAREHLLAVCPCCDLTMQNTYVTLVTAMREVAFFRRVLKSELKKHVKSLQEFQKMRGDTQAVSLSAPAVKV